MRKLTHAIDRRTSHMYVQDGCEHETDLAFLITDDKNPVQHCFDGRAFCRKCAASLVGRDDFMRVLEHELTGRWALRCMVYKRAKPAGEGGLRADLNTNARVVVEPRKVGTARKARWFAWVCLGSCDWREVGVKSNAKAALLLGLDAVMPPTIWIDSPLGERLAAIAASPVERARFLGEKHVAKPALALALLPRMAEALEA